TIAAPSAGLLPRKHACRVPPPPPYVAFDPAAAALVLIDMQRDVLEPGGSAAALGHDVGRLRPAIAPSGQVLRACRAAGMLAVQRPRGPSTRPVRPRSCQACSRPLPRRHRRPR